MYIIRRREGDGNYHVVSVLLRILLYFERLFYFKMKMLVRSV